MVGKSLQQQHHHHHHHYQHQQQQRAPRPEDCELGITSLRAALGENVGKPRPLRERLTEVLQKILVG
ncbi:hypothetical protein VYU27_002201 [Nannochloropsis oceanica]